jgi:hypothetical protein
VAESTFQEDTTPAGTWAAGAATMEESMCVMPTKYARESERAACCRQRHDDGGPPGAPAQRAVRQTLRDRWRVGLASSAAVLQERQK